MRMLRMFVFGMAFLAMAEASHAQVLSGKSITVGNAPSGSALMDITGNGNTDMEVPAFTQSRRIVGTPDAQGFSRVKEYEWYRGDVINPLTGKVVRSEKMQMSVLVYDANASLGIGNWPEYGEGVFTVGAKRYAASLKGIDVGNAAPRGDKHIDVSLYVNVLDVATGAVVRKFMLTSNPTWRLDMYGTGFYDITMNGVTKTYFVEQYDSRPVPPATPPAPGAKRVSHAVSRIIIWDAMRTKVVKQIYKARTDVFIP